MIGVAVAPGIDLAVAVGVAPEELLDVHHLVPGRGRSEVVAVLLLERGLLVGVPVDVAVVVGEQDVAVHGQGVARALVGVLPDPEPFMNVFPGRVPAVHVRVERLDEVHVVAHPAGVELHEVERAAARRELQNLLVEQLVDGDADDFHVDAVERLDLLLVHRPGEFEGTGMQRHRHGDVVESRGRFRRFGGCRAGRHEHRPGGDPGERELAYRGHLHSPSGLAISRRRLICAVRTHVASASVDWPTPRRFAPNRSRSVDHVGIPFLDRIRNQLSGRPPRSENPPGSRAQPRQSLGPVGMPPRNRA